MMNLRSFILVIGFFAVFFSAAAGSSKAANSTESLVSRLHLSIYEAAMGDMSLCANDEDCLINAKKIKSWVCADAVCEGKDKSKSPIACFNPDTHKYSIAQIEQVDGLICPVIMTPSHQTRQSLLDHLSIASENGLVEEGAYLLALKGSASSCEEYIKSYIGTQLNNHWLRALSGCRILAHESTREKEEKTLDVWFKAHAH